jgi:uncharacterized protein GlcG (DUF336 family)
MPVTPSIPFDDASRIVAAGIRLARARQHAPLTLVVLDRGGYLVCAEREDDSGILRFEIAFGRAWSCLALGHSARFVEETPAKNAPLGLEALAAAAGGRFVPGPGGMLIRDEAGRLRGALGVTGDSGENDERVGVQAIAACGFKADLT